VKLYVLIRKDLKKSHQAVQGGHALAELLLNYKLPWDNGTLIYLGVKNEKELRKLYKKLPCRKKAAFEEPYWDYSMTAIAAYGNKLPKFLRKLQLL
jgi:hypothetical protein